MKTLVLWALRIKAFWEKEWKYGVTALVGGVLVCVLWSGVYAANIPVSYTHLTLPTILRV